MSDTTSPNAGATATSARSSNARPGLLGRGAFSVLFALLAFDLAGRSIVAFAVDGSYEYAIGSRFMMRIEQSSLDSSSRSVVIPA